MGTAGATAWGITILTFAHLYLLFLCDLRGTLQSWLSKAEFFCTHKALLHEIIQKAASFICITLPIFSDFWVFKTYLIHLSKNVFK